MIEIVETVRYDQQATVVFAVLTDFAGYPAWQDAVESASLVDGPLRVGAHVREIRREFGWRGQVDVTVAEFVPGELLTLATAETVNPSVHQSYRLAGEPNGCQLRYSLALGGIPRLFEPVVRPQLQGKVRRMLRRLSEQAVTASAKAAASAAPRNR